MMTFIIFIILISLTKISFAQSTFSNQSEISYVNNYGNSNIQTINLKTDSSVKKGIYELFVGGHYTYGENGGDISSRNWDVNVYGEQKITKKSSLVLGKLTEGNAFTQIKARYNFDVEFKHKYVDRKDLKVFVQFGYRYSIEDRYSPLENTYDNKLRIYQESLKNINEHVDIKLWLEVIQNLTRPKDYLFNGEISMISMINSTFSLKFSYKGVFDNEPARVDLKKFDSFTTTSLVTKF